MEGITVKGVLLLATSVFILMTILFFLIHFAMSSKNGIQKKIDSYVFNTTVLNKMAHKYPGIKTREMNLCVDALKSYLIAVAQNIQSGNSVGKSLGMPSIMADSLWHEFILDTKNYIAFCESLGIPYIHHNPGTAIFKTDFSNDDVDRETLETFKVLYAKNKKLPLLFELDKLLGLKNGFNFNVELLLEQSNKKV